MKQRKNSLAFGISLTLLFSLGSLAQAQTYDAAADFNPGTYASNPNGVWRYGYTTTLGGSFIQHTESGYDPLGVQFWRTNMSSGAPNFEKNISGTTVFGWWQPGQISLHGGPSGQFSVLRFTAPSTGNYDISTTYFNGNVGDTDIYLLRNGATIASDLSTNGGGVLSFNSLLLNANDTIDVALGNGGDGFTSDGTPLSHTITVSTAAPEPGTLVLLSLGTFGAVVLRRTKGDLS
ncbi:PEP-CTERM sorting domain-containing protein [Armatimonas sp.]|uniref:PEP-CTERM sorting domain-containing protein n=1 Tax=Armatimonas sp. TaxID=1872638 RepID=UPI003753C5F1